MLKVRWLALPFVLAVMLIAPAVSQATAIGYSFWGAFHWKGFSIPSGALEHEISGFGLYVNWDGADFVSAGNLCDSSIRFSYGYHKEWINGNVHRGCSHGGVWKYSLKRNVPRGTACAALYIYDWRHFVTEQCHFVY